MDFNEKLKLLRADNKISQRKLAEELGISFRAIQNYEAGKQEPTLSVITSIADYFSVPADYLIGCGLYAKQELIEEHFEIILDSLSSINFDTQYAKSVLETLLDTLKSDLPMYEKIHFISFFISDIYFVDGKLHINYKFK